MKRKKRVMSARHMGLLAGLSEPQVNALLRSDVLKPLRGTELELMGLLALRLFPHCFRSPEKTRRKS